MFFGLLTHRPLHIWVAYQIEKLCDAGLYFKENSSLSIHVTPIDGIDLVARLKFETDVLPKHCTYNDGGRTVAGRVSGAEFLT